jgi:hypothetical protein
MMHVNPTFPTTHGETCQLAMSVDSPSQSEVDTTYAICHMPYIQIRSGTRRHLPSDSQPVMVVMIQKESQRIHQRMGYSSNILPN